MKKLITICAVVGMLLTASAVAKATATRLLLHCDGDDESTSFPDDSGQGHTVTAHGNAQVDTAVKKWGTGSLLLDGDGDYLSSADSADWDICGSLIDNWTIDFQIKLNDHSGSDFPIYQGLPGGNTPFWYIEHRHAFGFRFLSQVPSLFLTAYGGEITDNDWHHIALCKVGNKYGIYKDGTQVCYVQSSNTGISSGLLYIGTLGGVYSIDGHMDEIRITHSNIFDASPNVDLTDTIVPESYCNDYIIPGRARMFEGTLSGLREAYEIFGTGLDDPNCTDNKQLIFLHALTGTAMLVIRDDANSIDNVLELAREFGIELLGDYLDELEVNYPLNQYDAYEIPDGAPDTNEVAYIINNSIIPEINDIIVELGPISDPNTDCDGFKIWFTPDETGLEKNLEVDCGEVLILRGFLLALKAQLEAQAAYDMCIDANDMLVEKVYGDSFNINADLLDPHPHFLKVLPTPCHPDANGKAILAQARQDWIDSIDYYLVTIDYIRCEREEDPNQEDDLLYIDPNDDYVLNEVNDRLITLRDSLAYDTIITYPLETTKTYNIYDSTLTNIGQLVLVYHFPGIEGEGGSLIFWDGTPSPWEVEWFDSEIGIEVEYYAPGEWREGWLEGTLSEDGTSITGLTFDYWGDVGGSLSGLSGELAGIPQVTEQINFDLNPVFGSSAQSRYPDPVNPRDLLPEFDEWNGPQPNTVGHGLPTPNDATLGGILPDMTQYDWQISCDLQPGGLFIISPGTVSIDGYVDDWTEEELVFEDIQGDTEDNSNIPGMDIEKLYMAYDSDNLYGAITFYDNISSSIEYWYQVGTSYYTYGGDLGSIIFDIYVSGGVVVDAEMSYKDLSAGYPAFTHIADFDAVAGPSAVEFKVPLVDITNIPAFLPGRFISVLSSGWDLNSGEYDDEWNGTHLKIEGLGTTELGTISGNVTYDDYIGAPIFVQAYTDPWDPEDSIVASTMITAPGPYTLEAIGIGWEGCVRAFTPLFGFNVFDLEALTIQDSIPVFLMYTTLDGVDLELNNPTLLEKDTCEPGEIDPDYEEDWYSFYAVQGGTYTLDLNRLTSQYASMILYGRDGHTELQELYYLQPQHIDFNCPESGRFYVKVSNSYCQPDGGTYELCMTSNVTCPKSDIGAADWAAVEDCKVDFYDLDVLTSHWLDICSEPYWCDDADFDESGSIDFADFTTLANEWLEDGSW